MVGALSIQGRSRRSRGAAGVADVAGQVGLALRERDDLEAVPKTHVLWRGELLPGVWAELPPWPMRGRREPPQRPPQLSRVFGHRWAARERSRYTPKDEAQDSRPPCYAAMWPEQSGWSLGW